MTFTKTSQKFGQWSDVRANTVYGLGFSSEAELGKVSIVKSQLIIFNIIIMDVFTVYRKISRSERSDRPTATSIWSWTRRAQ